LFASLLYGGPLLSRQKNYCNLTAKRKTSRQKEKVSAKRKPHGKKKKTHGKISAIPRGHFNSFFFCREVVVITYFCREVILFVVSLFPFVMMSFFLP